MRVWFIALLVLFALCVEAQNFVYPTLPEKTLYLKNFIPKGWSALDTVYGDLGDTTNVAVAMVIEYTKDVPERLNFDDPDDSLPQSSRPRVLMILTIDSASGMFHLVTQNNLFILRSHEGGDLLDPFEGLQLEKGLLTLNFSGLTNEKWKVNYTFKYNNSEWELIKAHDISEVPGEKIEDFAYDFLTKKVTCKVNFITRNINKVTELDIKLDKLKTLDTFLRPFTWEVLDAVFL